MPRPRYLYKYRSLSGKERQHTRAAINDVELFFAPPSTINDPFEFRFRVQAHGSREEWIGFMRTMIQRRDPDADRWEAFLKAAGVVAHEGPNGLSQIARSFPPVLWKRIESEAGILSLTSQPADILMWAHYADMHRGVCIELDTTLAEDFFDEVQPVRYAHDIPVVDAFKFLEEETASAVFLTKSDHWKYEQEWRVVRVPEGSGVARYPPEALVRVILGCRTSSADVSAVREWIQKSPAEPALAVAEQHESQYSLNIRAHGHAASQAHEA
jgi:hypothetical protein